MSGRNSDFTRVSSVPPDEENVTPDVELRDLGSLDGQVRPDPEDVALAVCIARLRGTAESGFGDRVLNLLTLAATLWPIAFAAVVGPLLRTSAQLCAERGAKLGTLETLITSTTITNTAKACFNARVLNFWTPFLLLLWCLSPLGGQAAVRVLQLHSNATAEPNPILFFPGQTLNYSTAPIYDAGIDEFEEGIMGLRTLVSASFGSPNILTSNANGSSSGFAAAVTQLGGTGPAVSSGQQDLWRNVRVPFLQHLEAYNATRPRAWVDVPDNEIVPYDSLIGIPVRGLPTGRAGNASFIVQSTYQTLSCGPWTNSTFIQSGDLFFHKNYTELFSQKAISIPGTPNIYFDLINDSTLPDNIRNGLFDYPTGEPASAMQLVMGTQCSALNQTVCTVHTSYVDTAVNCTRTSISSDLSCRAVRARHTPGRLVDGNTTAFSARQASQLLLLEMPFTTASLHPALASFLETYLQDPPSTLAHTVTGNIEPYCYSDTNIVPRKVFETRLATALNTFIRAGYNSTVISGADGTGPTNRASPFSEGAAAWTEGTATWTEFTASVYRVNDEWFALYFIATLVLALCAVTNLVLQCFVRAPEVLGSLAGLVRDSFFLGECHEGDNGTLVVLPYGHSAMDRSDFIREVKKLEVRLRDVQPEMEVGRIALAPHVGRRGEGGLNMDRLYE